MSTAEQIIHEIATLRPEKQSEVLEFVEFLKEKEKKNEENTLRNVSLTSAMRGMEEEESLYTESDVVEKIG
jgi:4-hydroxyphenylpyruvate dioxygenase-like putative hemolysin